MEDINKDIEILENLLEEGFEAMCYPEAQAIEHLIQAYKELEEENRTLKNVVSEIFNSEDVTENFIPVSLVEEKIEELNKEEQELQDSISDEEREEYSDANISFELMNIEIRRGVLQELYGKKVKFESLI